MNYTLTLKTLELPVPTIMVWLHAHVGKRHSNWQWKSLDYFKSELWFKHEEDKVKFILRWM